MQRFESCPGKLKTSPSRSKLLLWISRFAVAVSVLVLLFVTPLCYCPRYYILLSALGLVPLMCGPRLYRWFGAASILAALLFAVGEHRAALNQPEQIEDIRAPSQTKHP